MKRALVTYAAPLLIGFAAFNAASQATGQTGPGWISLFDGKTIGNEWDRVGETNWRVEDGAIVADKRTSKDPAYLVTKANTRTSRSMSNSGRATTPTAASSSAARNPRRSPPGPATRSTFSTRPGTRPTAPAGSYISLR